MIEFEKALTDFTAAALAGLEASLTGGTVVPQRLRTRIVEESPGSYRTEGYSEGDWLRLVARHDHLIHDLPEFRAFVDAARANPTVWRHVETPIRVGNGTAQLRPSLAAGLTVEEVLRRAGGPKATKETIDEVARAFVEFLAADRLVHIISVPVLGLTLEAGLASVHRDFDIEPLDRTDREKFIDEEANVAWRSSPAESWGHAWAHLRRTVAIEKWNETDVRSRTGTPAIVEDAEAILMALRLVKGNVIRLAGVTIRPAVWIPLGLGVGRMEPGTWSQRLKGWAQISASESADVKGLAGKHERALSQHRRSYAESARRMHLGAEREQPEDSLVDYMIAFESILMADGDKPELSYRLALRTAAACATSALERAGVFGRIKSAYNLRSKIVHGDRRSSGHGGTFAASLTTAISQSETLLRTLLREYLTSWSDKSEKEFLKAIEHAVVSGEPLARRQPPSGDSAGPSGLPGEGMGSVI